MFRAKSENNRYKTTVFIICLAISAMIWIMIKLSETFTTQITFPLKYSGVPEGKVLINEVDSTIKVEVHEQGFLLLGHKYLSNIEPFTIDLSKHRIRRHGGVYEITVNTSNWAHSLISNYGIKGDIVSVFPDTILFQFSNEGSRTVPVVANVKTEFKKQYFMYDSVKISPSKVTISGLPSQIDSIRQISTEKASFTNLSETVSEELMLVKPAGIKNLEIDPSEVRVTIQVEKFTESDITVPVKIINNPKNYRLKLFPDKVNITCHVALIDFKKLNPELFFVVVDVSEISQTHDKKLKVKIRNSPDFTRISKIEPAEVEFIILK